VYEIIEEASGGRVSVSEMCKSLGVLRAEYYRWRSNRGRVDMDEDLELREEIQRVALEWSSYGYRRITAELRRRGIGVNHKRVLRLMREDNLLCLRKRGRIWTTDSNYSHKVYPNLARDLELSGVNQLWVADITYIRLLREFVYLAVILDAYSRRCIGWQLGQTLESELAIGALKMALCTRHLVPGLVHHSDQGVQYASDEYTKLLRENRIQISMSRQGNPYDNAKAESFIKTLKMEEVYMYEYESMEEAYSRIGNFLEEVYNQKRLHSALGYVPPVEFEQSLLKPKVA
jgi:transposase InsO family protein